MKENQGFNRRQGMGCNPDDPIRTVEPEILPPRSDDGRLYIGRVQFDRSSTLNSPCFWMLLGIGVGVLMTCKLRDR